MGRHRAGGTQLLTPLDVDATGLVLVDKTLHLVWPGRWEQQGVEPGVPLLLVDEFGQVLFGHIGFCLGVAAGQRKESQVASGPGNGHSSPSPCK